jgi:hypothetical protein
MVGREHGGFPVTLEEPEWRNWQTQQTQNLPA